MRKIGTLPGTELAARFQQYLETRAMKSRTIPAADGVEVWIVEEDHLQPAREALAEFSALPESDKFSIPMVLPAPVEVSPPAAVPRSSATPVTARGAHLTFALILASIVVSAATAFGAQRLDLLQKLTFSNWVDGGFLPAEVMDGQVWRLWTPLFLHFSIVHLLFNMLMLWRFGGQIEFIKGWRTLAGLVLVIGAISNFAQYFLSVSLFGGMSGVIYGLFGYQWMRARWLPEEGFWIDNESKMYMLGWMILCMTGAVGNIANTAHVAGLLSGMALGALPRLWRDA